MIGAIWSLRWSNPYTSPPDGRRVIKELFFPVGHRYLRICPPELRAIHTPGNGYSICWAAVSSPPKKLPQDKLALARQKRLRHRIEKKYPLLAEQIIRDEIKKRPGFYAGELDESLENARDTAESFERLRLVRLVNEFTERQNETVEFAF